MTVDERIEALERRRDHLRERLANWDPERNPSRTRAELSALDWALDVIYGADDEGDLEELSATGRRVRADLETRSAPG